MQFSYVYLLASQRNGTLYTGVTSDLVGRVWQHKHDVFAGFARKYGCKTLVWFEMHDEIDAAIRKEKQVKRWHRAWKLRLIETVNPDWRDLWDELVAGVFPEVRRACSGPGLFISEV
ncbi:MAG: GIY-YIG nuclease family protein [Hyphomonas sp.]